MNDDRLASNDAVSPQCAAAGVLKSKDEIPTEDHVG